MLLIFIALALCVVAQPRPAARARSSAYRKPYGGRRTIIHKRNGGRQYAVRSRAGKFRDIQQIGRASRMDQRRKHLVTADRPSRRRAAAAPAAADVLAGRAAPARRSRRSRVAATQAPTAVPRWEQEYQDQNRRNFQRQQQESQPSLYGPSHPVVNGCRNYMDPRGFMLYCSANPRGGCDCSA